MKKKLSITISAYIFDSYLRKAKNRSGIIEESILKAADSDNSELFNNVEKVKTLNLELREREEEIRKLKVEIGKLKSTKKERDMEEFAKDVQHRTLVANNPAKYPEGY